MSELKTPLDTYEFPESMKEFGLAPELPAVVVDDDFFEYIEEESVENTLDIGEFVLYYLDWAKENVEIARARIEFALDEAAAIARGEK